GVVIGVVIRRSVVRVLVSVLVVRVLCVFSTLGVRGRADALVCCTLGSRCLAFARFGLRGWRFALLAARANLLSAGTPAEPQPQAQHQQRHAQDGAVEPQRVVLLGVFDGDVFFAVHFPGEGLL